MQCKQCKKVPAESKRARCTSCLRYCREATNRWRAGRPPGICMDCRKTNTTTPDSHYCSACRAHRLEIHHKYIEKRKGLCIHCYKRPPEPNKTVCKPCLKHVQQLTRERTERIKRELFAIYGKICRCCGENTPEFLTVDHVNNDGNTHRRQLRNNGGYTTYKDIKKQGFPPTFQILCWNCNQAKYRNRLNGGCPHQQIQK